MYFSEPALSEIEDARDATTLEYTAGFTSRFLTFTRRKTVAPDHVGSADKVDAALKRARAAGRPVWRNLDDVTGAGAVFDIKVSDLHLGVLPFLCFGGYAEHTSRPVRVFWAQAIVPPHRPHAASLARELILLGSLNKVTNEPWSGEDRSALKIGHAYPSDPSVLSKLVQAELQLDDPSVQNHIDSVGMHETFEPGCYALFASMQTARARKALCRDEGFVTTWERRPPLRHARIVAITDDVCKFSADADADSAVLARPVLIRDLST